MKKYFIIIFLLYAISMQAEDRLGHELKINNIPVEFSISSIMTMPGDTLIFEFTGSGTDQFIGQYSYGELIEDSRLNWRYIMPNKPGHYELIILHNDPPQKLILNLFVLTPAGKQKGEYINGYRIGNYPTKPFRDNPKYIAPEGFIEVTEANKDVWVSPHFQLKQFLCKQQQNHWPKYMMLDPLLLTKLELIIEKLQQKGLKAGNLFIMSGYRTPYYNSAIGNGKYSRHLWGDAADIYIDENQDGVIDDLNQDGKASMKDADVIYQVAESIDKDPKYKHLLGGLGKYNKTASHTWDVHIDTRGYKARW